MNFQKNVDELGPDRTRDLKRVTEAGVEAVLAALHKTDPSGALRLLLTDRAFVERHGLSDLISCPADARFAFNFLENAVDAFDHEPSKLVQRQFLSLAAARSKSSKDAPTRQEVCDCFGVSERQAKAAKLHAAQHFAGAVVEKEVHDRQRLSLAQVRALTRFSISAANVYIPAHSSSKQTQFKRTKSLKKLMKSLTELMTSMGIPTVSKATMMGVMCGPGYGRMKCYTGLCETCSKNGYQNWQEIIKLVDELCNLALRLKWEDAAQATLQVWKDRINSISVYYQCDFKDLCKRDSPCASLCLQYALGDPTPGSMGHSKCDHEHHMGSDQCNDRYFVFRDLSKFIDSIQKKMTSDMDASVVEKWRARLEKAEKRSLKYIAHLMRDANAALDQDEYLKDLGNDELLIIADYMMKWKGSKFTENGSQCFGKQPVSLLGLMIIRRVIQADIDLNRAAQPSACNSSSFLNKEHLQQYLVSHINVISGDTQQDWYKFSCDLCAGLKVYHGQLNNAHASNGRLDTDGAANLSGAGAELMISLMEEYTGITIGKHELCEAGHGKTIEDGYFQTAKGHADSANRDRMPTLTDADLKAALDYAGGLPGTTNVLLDYDRSKQPELGGASKDLAGRSLYLSTEHIQKEGKPAFRFRENASIGPGRDVSLETALSILEVLPKKRKAEHQTDAIANAKKLRSLVKDGPSYTIRGDTAMAAEVKISYTPEQRKDKQAQRHQEKEARIAKREAAEQEKQRRAAELCQTHHCRTCNKAFLTLVNCKEHEAAAAAGRAEVAQLEKELSVVQLQAAQQGQPGVNSATLGRSDLAWLSWAASAIKRRVARLQGFVQHARAVSEKKCRSIKVVKAVGGMKAVEREGCARDFLNVGLDSSKLASGLKKSAVMPPMGYARNQGREGVVRHTPEQKRFMMDLYDQGALSKAYQKTAEKARELMIEQFGEDDALETSQIKSFWGSYKGAKKAAADERKRLQEQWAQTAQLAATEAAVGVRADAAQHIVIGKAVQKRFSDGIIYDGKVVSYDHKKKWFKVVYSDGDAEEMRIDELEPFLLQKSAGQAAVTKGKQVKQASVARSAGQAATDAKDAKAAVVTVSVQTPAARKKRKCTADAPCAATAAASRAPKQVCAALCRGCSLCQPDLTGQRRGRASAGCSRELQ